MKKMFLKIEKWFDQFSPVFTALLLTALYWFWAHKHITVEKFMEMNTAVISVAAIAVGFLGTTKAILISISNTRIIKLIKRSGEYQRLLSYIFCGIWSCLLLVLSCTALMLLDLIDGELSTKIVFSIWFALAGYAITASIRIVWILSEILKNTNS